MVLQPWIRKVKTKLSQRPYRFNGYFLDERDFRFEATRERIRADRNGSPLAILIIELAAKRGARRDFDFLARVLKRRLRITDAAGIVAPRRIGVLLPDTSKGGAWKVASDICEVFPLGPDRPNCEVFIYPEETAATDDADRELSDESVDLSHPRIEAFFAHPMPFTKRLIDVVAASLGLVAVSPALVVLAALVKATSPGPVFFAQEREGHGGKTFRMYKLRTMRRDAHQEQSLLRALSEQDGPAFKMSNDPRTTWIGRFLRRTSLDELPQLWNVLMGDMSLVGPRPLPVEESLQCASWQRQRLAVVPGLTCVWQVRGRSTVAFEQWMRMDLEYLRRRSLSYDVNILLRTVPSLLFSRGPR
jgi:lipopolysaccharide/colanic/teichoic acid biosynthesis glycosyltransferase